MLHFLHFVSNGFEYINILDICFVQHSEQFVKRLQKDLQKQRLRGSELEDELLIKGEELDEKSECQLPSIKSDGKPHQIFDAAG